MVRARAGDIDVLPVRQHGHVCALVHACAHLGGPLSEGTLKGARSCVPDMVPSSPLTTVEF